jgi:hypothetical protein
MRIFVSTIAVGLALAGAADAVTLTYSYDIAATRAPFTSNFTLPSFVTSLGTLTNVEIERYDALTATSSFFNLGTSTQSFMNALAIVPFEVTGPDGSMISEDVVAGLRSGVARPGSSAVTVSSTDTASVTASDFSAYESATAKNLGFTAVANSPTFTDSNHNGMLFIGGTAAVGSTVEVVYTYTAAPEPAAWGLMIVGFGMMGGVLRRRSATAASI